MMYQVSVEGTRTEVERISEAMDSIEPPPANDWRERRRGQWIIDIFLENKVRAGACAGIIELLFPARRALIRKLPDTNWVEKSYENLPPVTAGKFRIAGNHVQSKARTGQIPILIEAGAAFGTGHHGTTLGCLSALELVLRRTQPIRVLDIGTGTGVLAIASLQRGSTFSRGTDLSSDSIAIATENAKKNCVASQFKAYKAYGINDVQIRRFAPYDLVFSNILARPLIQIAPDIRQVASENSYVILSGLLHTQESIVTSAYTSQGFRSVERLRLKEWSSLLLQYTSPNY